MKILGRTEKGFLVDCTVDEVALMKGYRNGENTTGFYESDVYVNSTIELRAIHNKANYLRGVATDDLKRIQEQLQAAIKKVDGAIDTVEKVQLFETVKDKSGAPSVT